LINSKRAVGAVFSLICLGVLCSTRAAQANPRVFPFTYTVDTMPKGELELEQYVDYIPVRVQDQSGKQSWYGATDFQTELEFGLTPKLELGLYVTFAPTPATNLYIVPTPFVGDGMKERLKYRFAEAGEWPIDVGVYGELVEDQREFEIEAKVLLERRIGPVRIALNLTGEHENYFTCNVCSTPGVHSASSQQDWVLNPSAGVSVEATPAIQPGVESFLWSEYTDPKISPRPFDLGPHLYVGPTLLSQFGRLWWNVGAYARVTDTAHRLLPGESFGNFWVRSVIGYEL
jgi:hypothetical protein